MKRLTTVIGIVLIICMAVAPVCAGVSCVSMAMPRTAQDHCAMMMDTADEGQQLQAISNSQNCCQVCRGELNWQQITKTANTSRTIAKSTATLLDSSFHPDAPRCEDVVSPVSPPHSQARLCTFLI